MKKLAILCLTLISCGPVEIMDPSGAVKAVDRDFIKTKTVIQDDLKSTEYLSTCNCTHLSLCYGFNYNTGKYDFGMHMDCPGTRPCQIKTYVGTYHYRYVVEEQPGESWEGRSELWTKQWQEQISLGTCQ